MKTKETISLPTRRSALKYLGMLGASAAGREFLAAWLPRAAFVGEARGSIAHSDQTRPYTPQFFEPAEFRIVEALTEMILPSDGAPGAKEARVADYIDWVVFSAAEFEPALERQWRDGLAYLDRESERRFAKRFGEAAEEDRIRLLEEMSAPESDPRQQHEGYAFFRLVKEMTVEGFYTSKIGLIDVLDYQGMTYQADFPGCTHPEHQG